MFDELKNRDAWGAIRGYVYQVDLTILRWLELKEDEILELEKGEDIDIVSQDVQKEEVSRELEQIKFRQSNITLNQSFVLETLLNFSLHRTNNISKNIYFRFVTNASYGIERPALFPDATSGIEAWIECTTVSMGQGFTVSGHTASGFNIMCCPAATQGALRVRLGCTILDGQTDVTTCAFQQIRIKRDAYRSNIKPFQQYKFWFQC